MKLNSNLVIVGMITFTNKTNLTSIQKQREKKNLQNADTFQSVHIF